MHAAPACAQEIVEDMKEYPSLRDEVLRLVSEHLQTQEQAAKAHLETVIKMELACVSTCMQPYIPRRLLSCAILSPSCVSAMSCVSRIVPLSIHGFAFDDDPSFLSAIPSDPCCLPSISRSSPLSFYIHNYFLVPFPTLLCSYYS